jgi:predicted secreted protein
MMDMGIASGLAVFAMVWWVTLFVVLPFGARPDPNGDALTGWRGAPRAPRLRRAITITTILSIAIWLGIELIVRSDLISFRSGWLSLPEK